MKDCDICGGDRTIRLPVRRKVSFFNLDAGMPTAVSVDEMSRTYPCPKCVEGKGKAQAVEVGASAAMPDDLVKEDGFRDHVQRHLADAIGYELLKRGLIKFEKIKNREPSWRAGHILVGRAAVFNPDVLVERDQVAARGAQAAIEAMADRLRQNFTNFSNSICYNRDMIIGVVGGAKLALWREWQAVIERKTSIRDLDRRDDR